MKGSTKLGNGVRAVGPSERAASRSVRQRMGRSRTTAKDRSQIRSSPMPADNRAGRLSAATSVLLAASRSAAAAITASGTQGAWFPRSRLADSFHRRQRARQKAPRGIDPVLEAASTEDCVQE